MYPGYVHLVGNYDICDYSFNFSTCYLQRGIGRSQFAIISDTSLPTQYNSSHPQLKMNIRLRPIYRRLHRRNQNFAPLDGRPLPSLHIHVDMDPE